LRGNNETNQNDVVDRIELLSWLDTIKRDFDPKLLQARGQFPASGWFWPLIIRSLLGFKYKKMSDDSIEIFIRIFSSHFAVWGAIIIGIGGTTANTWIDWFHQYQPWPRTIGISLMVITFVLSIKANITRMLTLDDPYFNPNAYKLFRPKEYFMFLSFLKEPKHTFETVYTWVRLLYKENSLESLISEYQGINADLRLSISGLQSSLGDREKDLKAADKEIELLNRKIELLYEQVSANENGFNKAIDVVYRLRETGWPLFNFTDLRVLTGFSLFELVGDNLYMICEQETTQTPPHIHVNDPNVQHYSSVKLVASSKLLEYATSDREGRTVASYFIDLPSGKVLIYSFHYDSTKISISDIIESKEMYRFIKGICMHLEQRGLLERIGVRDAKA